MRQLIVPSLATILLACSPAKHTVIPDPVPVRQEYRCPDGESRFRFAPGVSNQTMDCRYKPWLEAAQRGELMFNYGPETKDRVHFATFFLEEIEGEMGSGWFAKDGERLTFERATRVRSGDKLTFVGGHDLESRFQAKGFTPGQQYTVMMPLIYAVAQPEKIIEQSGAMDPSKFCLPCEYRSQLGLDFFYCK